MADPKKKKLVDFPQYDPEAKVAFPPEEGTAPSVGPARQTQPAPAPQKPPYYESYSPDPPAPDPSQTRPGAPDIRDPDTQVAENQLAGLSPDVELKE